MKVFISYASEDSKIAKKLYNDLKQTGVDPWLDREDLLPGQNWKITITQAIKDSSYFLLLLSSYSISKQGFIQKQQKIALDILDEIPPTDIFIIPVNLDGCKPTDERLQDLHQVPLFSSYEEGLNQILRVFRQKKGDDVRPPNPEQNDEEFFVGRKDELEKMERLFSEFNNGNYPFFLIITGKGGIGKTRLAKYFIRCKKSELSGNLYEIDANASDIKSSIISLAKYFKVDPSEKIDNQSKKILRQIPSDSIILLDNIGNYGGYEILLEIRSKLFVIITTQSIELSPFRKESNCKDDLLKLSWLSKDDCELFYNTRLHEDVLDKLIQENIALDLLLSPLEQRSPFILKMTCDLLEQFYFEDNIQEARLLISKLQREIRHAKTVEEKLCKYPFDRVIENVAAKKLLLACALFTSGKIPLNEVLYTADISPLDKDKPLHLAQKWDLVKLSSEDGREYLHMHDVVHGYARKLFDHEETDIQRRLKSQYVLAWIQLLIKSDNSYELWEMRTNITNAIKMIPLIEITEEHLEGIDRLSKNDYFILRRILSPQDSVIFWFRLLQDEILVEKIAQFQYLLAGSFFGSAKFVNAKSFALISYYHFKKLKDKTHMGLCLDRLGSIYRSTGEFEGSIRTFRKAFSIYKVLDDKLSCADMKRQLARTYKDMGNISAAYNNLIEAKSILEELKKQTSNFEIKNSLAYTLKTLGEVQMALGQFKDAKNNFEYAKKMHEEYDNPLRNMVAFDLRALAKAELALNEIDEAIAHLQESLRIMKSFFGESPHVALIYLAEAEAYLKKNETKKALQSAEKGLQIYKRAAGESNKIVVSAYRILTEIYLQDRRLKKARRFFEKAQDIVRQKYPDSPQMSKVSFLEGKLRLEEGAIDEAKSILRQAQTEFTRFGMRTEADDVNNYLSQL